MVKCIFFLAILLAWPMAHAGDQPVQGVIYITTEYSPPTSMLAGGTVIGSATEKVREAMTRAGVPYSIELLPWKRAYAAALARTDGCVYSTTRTPERERLFKWIGPTDEGEWVLLGRADRRYKLTTLDDARGLRIGTYNGDAREAYLRARGFLIDSAPNDMMNPKKLMMNRVDLWAAGMRKPTTLIETQGWAGQIVPVLTFNHVKLYLACNIAVPNALVERINAAMDSMVRDGTTRRIERKYESWIEPKMAGPQ